MRDCWTRRTRSKESKTTASRAPRPRISRTAGWSSRPRRKWSSRIGARSASDSRARMVQAARPAAQLTGWPPKVVRWPSMGRSARVAIRARLAAKAPRGIPPPKAFARQTTSGSIPDAMNAKASPLRPKPVWISSTMSKAPAARHRACSSRSQSKSAGT